jgi:hypothetical protein
MSNWRPEGWQNRTHDQRVFTFKEKCLYPKSAAPCDYGLCMTVNRISSCPAARKECTNDCPACAYEAGADAMLDALFKLAKASPTGTFVIDSKVQNIYQERKVENE